MAVERRNRVLIEALRSPLASAGVPLSSELTASIAEHFELLLRFNRAAGFTTLVAPELAARRHYVDCLLVGAHLVGDEQVLDVGSAGGFPSVVWALQYPALRVEVREAHRRRANLLGEMVRRLGLADRVTVAHARVDDRTTPVDGVTLMVSRATFPWRRWFELGQRLLPEDGTLVAMVGPDDPTSQEASLAANNLGLTLTHQYRHDLGRGEVHRSLWLVPSSIHVDAAQEPMYHRPIES